MLEEFRRPSTHPLPCNKETNARSCPKLHNYEKKNHEQNPDLCISSRVILKINESKIKAIQHRNLQKQVTTVIKRCMRQGGVPALIQEDPTCCGATKPVLHNYWACALESMLCNKRSHYSEKPTHHNQSSPRLPQLEKSPHGNKDPAQPKIIK